MKIVKFQQISDKAKECRRQKRFKPLEDSFGEKDRFSALCELGILLHTTQVCTYGHAVKA